MIEGSGSGFIPLTSGSGSGSGRPKNMWIRIRIGTLVFNVCPRSGARSVRTRKVENGNETFLINNTDCMQSHLASLVCEPVIGMFSAYSADFFIVPPPACCETEDGGERDSCKIVEVHCPGRIACINPFHLLARQVEGGTTRGPPLLPTPHFQQPEASTVDL
jgi:hypothetical protein